MANDDSRLAARCAAIASLGAAVIHFAITPMHLHDWLPSGIFFAIVASFQLVWAFMAFTRPGSLVLAAGGLVNAGLAALWVMSRTVGPPVGPYAGQPEAVEAAGISVLLLQCYIVMGAGWAWSRQYQAEEVSVLSRALVMVGANTVIAGAVTVGLASSMHGHHHHHGVTEAKSGPPATQDQRAKTSKPPATPEPAPPMSDPAAGLPLTDMALHVDEDHHHGD